MTKTKGSQKFLNVSVFTYFFVVFGAFKKGAFLIW